MSRLIKMWWTLVGVLSLALVVGGGPFVDGRWPQLADQAPVTANIVAGAMLVPLELYIAGVLLAGLQNLRRRRQWQVAAAEFTEAMGGTWARIRDLLVYQYAINEITGPLSRIRAAHEAWQHLHRQETARADADPWADRPAWQLPDGASEAIERVALLWMLMWPAGLHRDWEMLHRKLTRVLVPRLSTDNPDLITTGWQLVDAIGDLNNLADDLLVQDNVFELPAPLDEDGLTTEGSTSATEPAVDEWTKWIADGEPELRMLNLDDLASAHLTARRVVEHGDRLMALLHAAAPRRHRSASRVRPPHLGTPRRPAFDFAEEGWEPSLIRSGLDQPVPSVDSG
ncbi:hypothetical protein [Micromonospora sp. NPDC093244]|uniref:hypothetical protein n=1 Tax=Micromonospora sp. NPDC093244 TaxID=3155071 RepID=UPI0034194111